MEYLEETRGEKSLLPESPADRAVVRQLVHMGTHTRTLARARPMCAPLMRVGMMVWAMWCVVGSSTQRRVFGWCAALVCRCVRFVGLLLQRYGFAWCQTRGCFFFFFELERVGAMQHLGSPDYFCSLPVLTDAQPLQQRRVTRLVGSCTCHDAKEKGGEAKGGWVGGFRSFFFLRAVWGSELQILIAPILASQFLSTLFVLQLCRTPSLFRTSAC